MKAFNTVYIYSIFYTRELGLSTHLALVFKRFEEDRRFGLSSIPRGGGHGRSILILGIWAMMSSGAVGQYRQYKNGGADEEYWASLVITTREHFRMPGVYASWQRQKSVLTSGFVALVDSWNVTPK